MALPDGATQVFSIATRFSALDENGFVAAGAPTYTTDQLLKATFTPVLETGVDLVAVSSSGDLAQHYKHGDMPKYYTMQIDVATPSPGLHALLAGGSLLGDTSAALATPGSITATPSTSGGTLTAAHGAYHYLVAAANQYGTTVCSAAVSGTIGSGSSGSIGLSLTAVAGAVYYQWYGRDSAGTAQLIATTTSPAYTDTGAAVPLGAQPASNTSAGPGATTGYQSPALGVVGNPNGIGVEFWGEAILNGSAAAYLPYYRWAVPGVKNLHEEAKNFGPTFVENVYTGEAFENPNWGAGPFSDWQFDSSRVFQYARAGEATLPTPGYATTPAAP